MPIKPGMHADVFFDRLSVKQAALGTIVYAVEGERITLSQTSPEILPVHVGRSVQISFIVAEGETVRRVGFSALVSGLVADYALASGEKVPAVLMDRKTEPAEMNLRRNVRVRPPKDSGVGLVIYRNRYEIADLSLMGLSFKQPFRERAPSPGDKMPLRLSLEGQTLALPARVVRVSEKAKFRVVAMAFAEVGPQTEALLWKTIFRIDRETLSRRLQV